MADDEPMAAEVAAAAPPATKAKRTKVEKLTADLATAEGKLSKLQTQHKALEAACKLGRRKLSPDAVSKRDEAATKCEGQVKAAKALVAATLEQLNLAKADAEAKAAAAAAKAAAAAAKAEETKPFTTAAIITMVTLKLQLQHKFDNKSDRGLKVWDEILKQFNAAVDKGDLPESDRRDNSDSLKSRFSKEFDFFKLHSRKVAAAKASGAECGEDGKPVSLEAPTHETCSTHVFWAHEVQNRPGVVPLHAINGGNAAAGGQHNPLKKRGGKRKAAAAEGGGDGGSDGGGDGDGDGDEDDEDGGSGSGSGGARVGSGGARGGSSGGLNMGGGGKQKYRPKKGPKAGVDSPPVWLEAAVAQFEAAEDRQREKDKEAAEERRQQHLKDVEALLSKYSGSAS